MAFIVLVLWDVRTCVTNYICNTEPLETITDLSGFDLLVTDTNCDFIGNSDVTSVFISKTGDDGRDLMFEYDGGAGNRPDFEVDDEGVIRVSVRYLYEVRERKDNWNGAAIEYNLTWGWLPEIVAPTLPVRPGQNLAPGGVGDQNVFRPVVEKAAIFAAGAFVAIGFCYVYFAFIRSPPPPDICSTRVRKTISDLQGVDFWVVETHCDLFAHAREARVYIAESGSEQRTLIFAYEPADERWLPNFEVDHRGPITLSLRGVNAVYFEDHNWGKATIDYRIGAEPMPKAETPGPR